MSADTLAVTILGAAVLSLAACSPPKVEVKNAPPAASIGIGSNLWRIEVMRDGAVASTLDICADGNIEAAFARPAPEIEGKPCVYTRQAVQTETTYAVRCRIDDQLYRVGADTKGDPRSGDFTVDMAVTRQDRKEPVYEQTRHYRRVGTCPAGWAVGDSRAPGAAQIVNTLSGRSRPASGA